MMPNPVSPKVVTANDLLRGDVVYQTPAGWTRRLAEAELLADEAVAELRLRDAQQQTGRVVGVYLATVTQTANGPEPAHIREGLRATGPSNYPHGKQVEQENV